MVFEVLLYVVLVPGFKGEVSHVKSACSRRCFASSLRSVHAEYIAATHDKVMTMKSSEPRKGTLIEVDWEFDDGLVLLSEILVMASNSEMHSHYIVESGWFDLFPLLLNVPFPTYASSKHTTEWAINPRCEAHVLLAAAP